ncbi:MAG: SMP-30/gluconolactonase/LRE family protein, partial [Ilumatobacteraceae bacterium]
YVDIDAGTIHRLDPASGAETASGVEPPISFVIPVDGGSRWVGGTGADLTLFDGDDVPIGKLVIESDRPANRFNDGKADPAGRLWFGSMSLSHTHGGAGFYRLDPAGLTTIDGAVTISNGLDWDVDRQRMYYVDSTEQRIDVFSFDASSGEAEDRRPFATIDPDDGLPDGLTVDADGGVWVALFRGGAVRRYDPDGAIVETIRLPVTCPTCPVFGGDDLATMFVTTSRHRLTEKQRAEQPLAGALLTVDAGVRGRPSHAVSAAVAALIGGGG